MGAVAIKGVDAAFEPVTYGQIAWGDSGTITLHPRPGHEAVLQRIRRMALLTPSGDRIAPEDPQWVDALLFGLSGSRLWAEPVRPSTAKKHMGPGDHPSGTPQSVHGSGGEGGEGAHYTQMDSAEFKEWFAGSKITDGWERPLVVYHQTTPEAAAAIRREGFRSDLPRARAQDDRVPDGVFFKPSEADIKIGGDTPVQVPVVLAIKNPLTIATEDSGAALKMRVAKEDPTYAKMITDMDAMDERYATINDRLNLEWKKVAAQDQRSLTERLTNRSSAMDHALQALDDNLKAWNAETKERATAMRVRVTRYLTDYGYDGLILTRDKGGFNRVTRTIVALKPEQIRLVSPLDLRNANRATWGKPPLTELPT